MFFRKITLTLLLISANVFGMVQPSENTQTKKNVLWWKKAVCISGAGILGLATGYCGYKTLTTPGTQKKYTWGTLASLNAFGTTILGYMSWKQVTQQHKIGRGRSNSVSITSGNRIYPAQKEQPNLSSSASSSHDNSASQSTVSIPKYLQIPEHLNLKATLDMKSIDELNKASFSTVPWLPGWIIKADQPQHFSVTSRLEGHEYCWKIIQNPSLNLMKLPHKFLYTRKGQNFIIAKMVPGVIGRRGRYRDGDLKINLEQTKQICDFGIITGCDDIKRNDLGIPDEKTIYFIDTESSRLCINGSERKKRQFGLIGLKNLAADIWKDFFETEAHEYLMQRIEVEDYIEKIQCSKEMQCPLPDKIKIPAQATIDEFLKQFGHLHPNGLSHEL